MYTRFWGISSTFFPPSMKFLDHGLLRHFSVRECYVSKDGYFPSSTPLVTAEG